MARLIGQILRGIARALAAGIRLPFDVLGDIGRMLGLAPAGAPLPPSEAHDAAVDIETAQLRHQLDTASASLAVPHATVNDAGKAVHGYASGNRQARDSFDLSQLEPRVSVALLTMQPAQLQRLALAGPEACGRWAEGQKGIVGVPLPDRHLSRAPDMAPESVTQGRAIAPACRTAPRAA